MKAVMIIMLVLVVSLTSCSLEELIGDTDLDTMAEIFYNSSAEEDVVITDLNSCELSESCGGDVSVASWNLQVFGTTKAAKPQVMEFYQAKLFEYDLIFVQEIRDASDTAFWDLCKKFPGHSCLVSQRDGRSTSKEQTGVIFKSSKLDVLDFTNIHDPNDVYERSPTKAVVDLGNETIIFYVMHLKPDDVESELAHFEDYAATQTGNMVLIGDLNADCSYYKPDVNTEFDSWNWLIGDDVDTTTSATDCAYDRIITNNDLVYGAGVDSFGINKTFSDHYIVTASVKV